MQGAVTTLGLQFNSPLLRTGRCVFSPARSPLQERRCPGPRMQKELRASSKKTGINNSGINGSGAEWMTALSTFSGKNAWPKKDAETVARADREGVAICQLDHCGIGCRCSARGTFQTARRTPGQTSFPATCRPAPRARSSTVLMKCVLPEDEVDCLGLLDLDAQEFHGWFRLSASSILAARAQQAPNKARGGRRARRCCRGACLQARCGRVRP